MLFNISVTDISTEKVSGVVCISTDIVNVFIPLKIAGHDDTEVLCLIYTFKLLFMKELGNVQGVLLWVMLITSRFEGRHSIINFLFHCCSKSMYF